MVVFMCRSFEKNEPTFASVGAVREPPLQVKWKIPFSAYHQFMEIVEKILSVMKTENL
jgi:hypothetical protein